VKKDAQPAQFEQAAGLCPRCSHVRVIESDRGSRFLLCSLFRSNPRFPKYPRLPVTQCPAFQPDASAWSSRTTRWDCLMPDWELWEYPPPGSLPADTFPFSWTCPACGPAEQRQAHGD